MSYKLTPALSQKLAAAFKNALDGGRLYLFAGPVPAAPEDALDMVASHTRIAVLTVGNDGATGLTFDAPVAGLLPKAAAEEWLGTVLFSGKDDALSELAPSFFRFGADGDTCESVSTGDRLQGTVGGPASAADLKLGAATLVDNGTNTVGVAVFNFRVESQG